MHRKEPNSISYQTTVCQNYCIFCKNDRDGDFTKVVQLCTYEMKKFMKRTSENLFNTLIVHDMSLKIFQIGHVTSFFNCDEQVCSGPSVPKHVLKVCMFSRYFMDKCISPL